MQLPTDRTPSAKPDMASLANAQHMWEFLDELSTSDPEEYRKFLAKQLETAAPKPPMPDAGFCVRAATGTQRTPLWINVCSHPSMKPPSSTPDGSVPIAVGVPRPATVAAEAGNACDVVVAPEVTEQAARDAGFREEVAALAVECVKDVLTTQRKLPAHQRIQPGYRPLPHSRTPYAGEPIPFVDARAPEVAELGSAAAASAAAAASGAGLSPEFDDMLRQLTGMAGGGGDASELSALAAQAMGGAWCASGGEARRRPDEPKAPCSCGSGRKAKQCCGASRGGGAAGEGGLSRAVVAAAASGGGKEEGEEEGGLGGQLRLPVTGTAPRPAKTAAGGGEAPRRPLVEVVASEASEPSVPEHTLETGAEAMVLRVELPLVCTAADLDVDLGDSEVHISVEGVYRLALPLLAPVVSARAACKFDRRKRRLTVTMPLAS